MCEQTDYQGRMEVNTLQNILMRAEFLNRPSVMLGLKPFPDGNKWSVLYGQNLQVGVCGFGDTPDQAMRNFDDNWNHQKLNEK